MSTSQLVTVKTVVVTGRNVNKRPTTRSTIKDAYHKASEPITDEKLQSFIQHNLPPPVVEDFIKISIPELHSIQTGIFLKGTSAYFLGAELSNDIVDRMHMRLDRNDAKVYPLFSISSNLLGTIKATIKDYRTMMRSPLAVPIGLCYQGITQSESKHGLIYCNILNHTGHFPFHLYDRCKTVLKCVCSYCKETNENQHSHK